MSLITLGSYRNITLLGATKQLYEWFSLYVHLSVHVKDGKVYIKTYGKQEVFNFHMVNYPDLSENIPLWARGPQRLGWGAELTHTATGEW